MRQFIQYKGYECGNALPLVESLVFLCERCIPKCTNRDVRSALLQRQVMYEFNDEDISQVAQLEHVMDMFNASDQQQLQSEVTSAKERNRERSDFLGALGKFKAAFSTQLAKFG